MDASTGQTCDDVSTSDIATPKNTKPINEIAKNVGSKTGCKRGSRIRRSSASRRFKISSTSPNRPRSVGVASSDYVFEGILSAGSKVGSASNSVKVASDVCECREQNRSALESISRAMNFPFATE